MQLQHLLLLASHILKSTEISSYLRRRGRVFVIDGKSIESTEARRRPVYVKARRKYSTFFVSGNPVLKGQNCHDGYRHKAILALQSATWRGVMLPKSRNGRIFQGKNLVEVSSSKPSSGEFCFMVVFCGVGLVFNWTSIACVSSQDNLQCHPNL